ncbi:hypothetical protein VTI28DRAFT_2730 [Corynascus sepedonium]
MMDFLPRNGIKKRILTVFSLLVLLSILRQYNATQKYLSSGNLSELLEVIDSCASNGSATPDKLVGVSDGGIPNVIHQIWKTTDVQTYVTEFGASHEAWKAMYEPFNYTVKLWTDDDVFQLIRTKYAWLLSTYEGYPHDIQRVDLARLAIILAEGGIYADLDVYPRNVTQTQCLQHLGLQAIFAPTRMGDIGLSNHFFMAEQGSPFLLWTLYVAKRRSVSASLRTILPYWTVLWTTGPLMVTAAFREYAWLYSAQRLNIGVLDEDKYRRQVLGHAAGRAWHGPDGIALNYMADHAPKAIFMSFVIVLSLLGLVWLIRKRTRRNIRRPLLLFCSSIS